MEGGEDVFIKKKSILFRILVIMMITTVLSNIVGSSIMRGIVRDNFEKRTEDESKIIMKSLVFSLKPLILKDDHDQIYEMIHNISEESLINSIKIYDSDLKVLYSNDISEEGQTEVNKCISLLKADGSDSKSEMSADKSMYQIAAPLNVQHMDYDSNEYKDTYLFMSINMDYSFETGDAIANNLRSLLVILSIILMVIIMIVFQRTVQRPLKRLKDNFEQIESTNYDISLDGNVDEEFEEIVIAFNKMAGSIKKNTEELKASKILAEEASEAKMKFVANMSHEIRTPLNSIIGFTDLLEENEYDEDKRRLLSIVNKAGKHLLAIISDILDFSKIDNDQIVLEENDFSIRMLIKEISDMFYLSFKEKNIGFRYEIDTEVPSVMIGDSFRIKQIIINIINNALKFTDSGSVVIIVSHDNRYLNISISDTGRGIEADKIEEIFDEFKQSDNSTTRLFGGTGLGLSISLKLAKLMGGSINVSSEIGVGSVFDINLKLKESMDMVKITKTKNRDMVERWLAADSEVEDLLLDLLCTLEDRIKSLVDDLERKDYQELKYKVHALKGVTGNYQIIEIYEKCVELDRYLKENEKYDDEVIIGIIGDISKVVSMIPHYYLSEKNDNIPTNQIIKSDIRILVAEDIIENRLLVEKILEGMNVNVDFAKDGMEAINMIEANDYDCLLLDIQMPILDGTEVLKWIRNNSKKSNMYIIALTANATKSEMEEYISLGSDWFLSKPIKKELLREKIREIMGAS